MTKLQDMLDRLTSETMREMVEDQDPIFAAEFLNDFFDESQENQRSIIAMFDNGLMPDTRSESGSFGAGDEETC